MAVWLQLDRPDQLLEKANSSSWNYRDGLLDGATAEPAVWEQQQPCSDSAAAHDVVWAPRAEGDVGIHRFRPGDGADMAQLLSELKKLGQQEMAAGANTDAASNVGGFHGARDLWSRPELAELWEFPTAVGAALKRATQTEALALDQVPKPTACDEAWFNMTGPDGWNRMHTHAGSTYACVVFVSDGGCCKAEQFGGRLCFVTNQPDTLPEYHLEHVRRSAGSSEPRHGQPGKRRKIEPQFV